MLQERFLFDTGHVLRTARALAAMLTANVSEWSLMERHRRGDHGMVSAHRRARNAGALAEGGRVLSAYRLAGGVTVWIITDADRAATTVLLPAEYPRRIRAGRMPLRRAA